MNMIPRSFEFVSKVFLGPMTEKNQNFFCFEIVFCFELPIVLVLIHCVETKCSEENPSLMSAEEICRGHSKGTRSYSFARNAGHHGTHRGLP